MSRTVWKSDAARQRLEDWYDRFLARVPVPCESRTITTASGSNHILLAGPADGTPIVCYHSMRTGAAHLLSELYPLAEHFRLILPDLPDQSVRGPQLNLSLKDDSLARWSCELLDALKLENVNVFGVSWGGFVARKLASTFPDRVRRLALLVPAGIVNGSHWKGLTRMALPLLRYRLRKSEANLKRFLDPLITTWDPFWAEYMAATLENLRTDLRIPPLATDHELRQLSMPVLALGAEDDLSFPGAALVKRIQSIVNHADCEVIAGSKHCPPTTPEFRKWLTGRLSAFFASEPMP